MKLFNWFHKDKKHVISNASYNRVIDSQKKNYVQVENEPTHQVEDDGFTTSLLVGMNAGSMAGYAVGGNMSGALLGSLLSDDSPSTPNLSSDDVPQTEFGGGSGGGGGATGDFSSDSSPSDTSSSDSSSSDYSSSDSSSDSSSSFDSGSSD